MGIAFGAWNRWGQDPAPAAVIEVDARRVTGEVSPYLFGHFIEHEHNIIQGGLWAELLRDRKFEQGDKDRDGVSDGWVPEERVANRYWELINGRGPHVRYFIDHQDYYGGGASQAIELDRSPSNHASIYQVGLHLVRGRCYVFYTYLKMQGKGKAWVDLEKMQGPLYGRKEYLALTGAWQKYSTEFTAPEDTDAARIRIGFEGVGTLWIDSSSLMPADNLRGIRRDVIEALRPLHIPIMRYPGGCFVDTYHWKDGTGPRDRRPETWCRIWDNWDPNDFGTDEFLGFAQELGFEPHITTNYGSGTVEEAAQWVEYANGSTDAPMGRLRAQNGHPHPYGVKFWAVGNEAAQLCAGQYIGSTLVSEYATRFVQFRQAMQKVDPSLRVIAAGTPPGPPTWNDDLVNLIPIDLLAVSIYTGESQDRVFGNRIFDHDSHYRKVVAEPREFERELDRVIHDTSASASAQPPLIAVTEFNSWWVSEKVDPDYRLGNALYFAGVFNVLLRRAPFIFTSEVATTLNVQGILAVNPSGVKFTPPYFAYLLYANHTGKHVLGTTTRTPMALFDPQLPVLDSVATAGADGRRIYLATVNRDESDVVPAVISLQGWTPALHSVARIYELNGRDKLAANLYNSTENVNIRETVLPLEGLPLHYRFQPHSVTVIEFQGTRKD